MLTLAVIATILLSIHAFSSLLQTIGAFMGESEPQSGFITSILGIITIWVLYGHIGG